MARAEHYYTTSDPGEAAWLCDEWGLPLSGKLVASCQPEAARRLSDALGMWTFKRTALLHEGVTAYRAGKATRYRAKVSRKARENAAARTTWQQKTRLDSVRERRRLRAQAVATPASLEKNHGDDPRDPVTLADRLTDGAFPDGRHTQGGPVAGSGWGLAVVTPLPSGRHRGTAIDPHPTYRPELDDIHIAIRAVWRLFTWGYWGLLARLGLERETKVAVEGEKKRWVAQDALESAQQIVTQWEPFLDLGWGADWLVELLCPFLEGVADRLLALYRERTRHPFAAAVA